MAENICVSVDLLPTENSKGAFSKKPANHVDLRLVKVEVGCAQVRRVMSLSEENFTETNGVEQMEDLQREEQFPICSFKCVWKELGYTEMVGCFAIRETPIFVGEASDIHGALLSTGPLVSDADTLLNVYMMP